MVGTVIESIIILAAIVSSYLLLKKNPSKARKTFAISFVLAFAVIIAFALAQLSAQFKLLEIALSYSPVEVLAFMTVVYWIAFVSAKGTLFDKVIGE